MAFKRFETKSNQLWGLATLLVAIIIAMAMLSKCSHSPKSPFDNTPKKSLGDTIDVAIQLNPTIYSVSGDVPSGRDYELLMKLQDECGLSIKLHPFINLGEAMDGLESGVYDIVAAAMPLTSALRDRFLMTQPLYLDREILVQRVDSDNNKKITSQIQLGGDTVWIPSNSPITERIKNLSEEIGDTICIRSDSSYTGEYLMMLVAKGEIDLAVVNENIAKSMADEYENIDISTPISFTQFQSWAINKENQDLLNLINNWIKRQ